MGPLPAAADTPLNRTTNRTRPHHQSCSTQPTQQHPTQSLTSSSCGTGWNPPFPPAPEVDDDDGPGSAVYAPPPPPAPPPPLLLPFRLPRRERMLLLCSVKGRESGVWFCVAVCQWWRCGGASGKHHLLRNLNRNGFPRSSGDAYELVGPLLAFLVLFATRPRKRREGGRDKGVGHHLNWSMDGE